jgi:hypothetical protein
LTNGEIQKLRKWRNETREDLKNLAREEAEIEGSGVKPDKNDIRF